MDEKIVLDFKDDSKIREVETVLIVNTGIVELLKAYNISYDILIATYKARGELTDDMMDTVSNLNKLSEIDKQIILKHEFEVFKNLGPLFGKTRVKFWSQLLDSTLMGSQTFYFADYVVNDVSSKNDIFIMNIDKRNNGKSLVECIPEIFDKSNELLPREYIKWSLGHFNEINKQGDNNND